MIHQPRLDRACASADPAEGEMQDEEPAALDVRRIPPSIAPELPNLQTVVPPWFIDKIGDTPEKYSICKFSNKFSEA